MPDRTVRPSRWETQTTNLRLCLITDSGWRFLPYNILPYAVRTCPSCAAWPDLLPVHSAGPSTLSLSSMDCLRAKTLLEQPVWWHLTSMDTVMRRWELLLFARECVHAGNMQPDWHIQNTWLRFSPMVAKLRTMRALALSFHLPLRPKKKTKIPQSPTLTCNTWRVWRPHSGMFLFRRSMSTELSTAPCDTWRSCEEMTTSMWATEWVTSVVKCFFISARVRILCVSLCVLTVSVWSYCFTTI